MTFLSVRATVYCIGAALAAPAFAQQLGGAPDDGVSLWRVIAALVLCLLIAITAAVLLKMRNGGRLPGFILRTANPERRLVIVESARIGPHTDLCIVACDEAEWLIASNLNDTRLIARLPMRLPPSPPAAEQG